jgi:hypothetical protein
MHSSVLMSAIALSARRFAMSTNCIRIFLTLYAASLRSLQTDLLRSSIRRLLAADGEGEFSPPVVNIATFFSDNPEVVLRVMRDTEEKRDYLQLVSADPSLVSNVLVRIPEQDKEFLTDSSGKAEITGIPTEDLEELGWQIKMPDAAFSLETLAYDPDSVEYRREIVLETEQNDRIRVSFEGKTEGKQIAISILELDGKTEFDSVRVILSQNDIAETRSITPSQIATFNLSDKVNTIKIRLFN